MGKKDLNSLGLRKGLGTSSATSQVTSLPCALGPRVASSFNPKQPSCSSPHLLVLLLSTAGAGWEASPSHQLTVDVFSVFNVFNTPSVSSGCWSPVICGVGRIQVLALGHILFEFHELCWVGFPMCLVSTGCVEYK